MNWWSDPEQLELLRRRFVGVGIDRRTFLQVVAAAGGAAALAACGGDDEEDEAATPASSTPGAVASPAASGDRESGKLATEQTFRWNAEFEPLSHDFNKNVYCGGIEILFGMLGQFDANLEVKPDIAESWEANEDGSVWTYHIREDTAWSNGDPVTAHDYEWSWKRQLDPATGAVYAGFLFDIKNAEAFNQGTAGVGRDDVGVKALDDATLEVTLAGPRAYFPVLTAYYATAPAHRASVERHGDSWTEAGNCISNGPFKLTRWDHNQLMVAEKNEGYWNASEITIQRIERPIIAAQSAPLAYENGEIDFLPRGQLGDYDRHRNDPTLSQQMVKYQLQATWYLVPDPNFPPFDLIEVRRAMAHAIDRQTIVDKVLRGIGTPAYTMTPPGMPGYNPNIYDEYTKFDPELALAALKGTPYEGGKNWPKLTLTQRQETDAEKAAAAAIIDMLKQHLGMTIEHEIGQQQDVYPRMFKREIPLLWVRWYIDYPDPNNTMYLVWYSKQTAGRRHSWSNEEFDRLVVQAAGEQDADKRLELYRQADEIMLRDYAAIFVYNPANYALLKPYVSGMPKNKNGDTVTYSNIFVRMEDHIQMLER